MESTSALMFCTASLQGNRVGFRSQLEARAGRRAIAADGCKDHQDGACGAPSSGVATAPHRDGRRDASPAPMVKLNVREIAISRFKATCLAVLEDVRRTRRPVRVTRFGKPVAEVVPPNVSPK